MVIGAFIALCQPQIVVELGTFVGVGTEFILNEMKKYGTKQMKLYTVDCPFSLDWDHINNRPKRSEIEIPGFSEVISARQRKIDALRRYSTPINFVFLETFASEAAKIIKEEANPDFIFHDATHSAISMIEDIKAFGNLNEGTVICFDNVLNDHQILNLLDVEFKEYSYFHCPLGTGQLWLIHQ